ncbi:Hypothetical protein SFBmNL_01125 [Candidatus Arthromitus sp. SFB-mouse-NL]|uniref:hypothetical protein n=1 Tax=Candidatus Arthromitus sp. SFB-mouse-NL TaxID=1508644 RepID=UPI00049B2108|nr:hypothetical protein [Candidatus Arthromitus sp. SFB-mouse-NL]AID45030.1 Hypothetical protein SFBmNL_01125 [Candidatus Arthromitus sp. SFB-mouse-NL]
MYDSGTDSPRPLADSGFSGSSGAGSLSVPTNNVESGPQGMFPTVVSGINGGNGIDSTRLGARPKNSTTRNN